VPIALDTTVVPTHIAPQLATTDFTTASLYDTLLKAGVEPLRADATIEAKEADAEAAARLNLDIGKPLLVMRQLALDAAERPLFISTISYAGDRYRLRTFFARSIRP
jgi:GntR family transcriptional regulator